MGKFRTYKNGLYGARYNGCYILPQDKGAKNKSFTIVDSDMAVIRENVDDFDECKWIIDLTYASEKDILMIKKLYGLEIIELTQLVTELMKKGEDLNENEKLLDKRFDQVRTRKSNGLELEI